jgi:transcriptional regulator with XRE-family HTH domain
MVVFRRLLGEVLRSQRMRKGRTLRQVSADARVSLGYISEIERGQKEASSELLYSICAALDVPLSEILSEVSDAVALEEAALAMQLEPIEIRTQRITTRDTRSEGDVVAAA